MCRDKRMACGCREASGQEYRHLWVFPIHSCRTGFLLFGHYARTQPWKSGQRHGRVLRGFDADAEAYLWLDSNGHGKNGAPYRTKDVLADMEAAEGMVSKLLEAVRDLTSWTQIQAWPAIPPLVWQAMKFSSYLRLRPFFGRPPIL